MGSSLAVPNNQINRSAKLEFTDHLNPTNLNSHDVAGVTLAYSDFTLYPERYRTAYRAKDSEEDGNVKFEVERVTKNTNIIKMTGDVYLQFYCAF